MCLMICIFTTRLRCFVTLLFLFILTITYPQKVLWEKTYGGLHADYLFDMQPTPDYGFILAGSSVSDVGASKSDKKVGVMDYWLWKMSETGKLEWQRSFGGDGTDKLNSIVVTADGGILLGGTSNSTKSFAKTEDAFGGYDFWVVRLDPFGAILWQKTYGGLSEDSVSKIIQTSDGGFLIGGTSSSNKLFDPATQDIKPNAKSENTNGNLDFWLLKIDASGVLEWQKTLGGKYADILKTVAQTPDGDYVVAGSTNSPISGDKTHKGFGLFDYWVLKLTQEGEILWQQTFGGEADDQLQDLVITKDSGILLAGNSNSPASDSKEKSNKNNSTDIWVLQLDKNGEQQWQNTYNLNQYTLLTNSVKSDKNSFVLGGYTQKNNIDKKEKGTVNSDYFVIKIDSLGETKWKKEIGSSGRDVLSKIVETRDGGYVLAGTSNGKVTKDKQSANQGLEDFWIVKLLDEDKDKKAKRLIEAYPNPTNDVTNVLVGFDFDEGTATMVDIAGRQLQHFAITSRTVPFSLRGLPIGIYLITIKTNKGSETVKILKGN